VRILIFHGYLLGGTGSNVYNAELCAALVDAGHSVAIVCQERDPFAFSWVDAAGDWDSGSLIVRSRDEAAPARATVYRPDIGGLLPVYVADRYEGIEARPFSELDDFELDRYLGANVAAVREVAARFAPDVALANHAVMGPVVLARALRDTVPYAVKIHGSALEYVVKPHPEFAPYAVEGLRGARGVLVGSRHTAESLFAALADPSLPAKTRLGPPGVDVARFTPREPAAARAGVEALVARVATPAASSPDDASPPPTGTSSSPAASSFARHAGEAAAALSAIEPGDRVVVFVGKLIASKGVELLLAAWPQVLAREPRARLVVVGFGGFRAGLEHLAGALAAGDLETARALRGEEGQALPYLRAHLAGADPSLRLGRVGFAGRLDHEELADLLPAADAMAVTSTFPEAFGMVAAEAAACGTLPVVANHSGLGEVAATLAAAVPPEARAWLSFELADDAVTQLADALSGWLAAPAELRRATREAIVRTTRERYSWTGVARTVIAAAQGDLASLPRISVGPPPGA
jgi:glycosyltransferase involved in cell wall biosynthesis